MKMKPVGSCEEYKGLIVILKNIKKQIRITAEEH
jgi:hypothetical protein